ncbi:MAG TPA: RHS repeat-associated core domain-containing protein, partial [Caldilineaceae bacterium]|nr:RHS repeat-associated core domain-containing protein [Caldilineaceae bacterium]
YRARYYDDHLGQFVSPDTIVPDPSLVIDYNRFAHTRGNPLKYHDPSGHCPICLILIMAGLTLMLSSDSALPPEEILQGK